MKTANKTVYIAFDDTEFDTERECRAHERANVARRLTGLNDDQIAAALSGADPDLGEAFEHFGDDCREARLERGGHKRRPKAGAGEPTAASLEEATNDPAQDAADEDKHAAA